MTRRDYMTIFLACSILSGSIVGALSVPLSAATAAQAVPAVAPVRPAVEVAAAGRQFAGAGETQPSPPAADDDQSRRAEAAFNSAKELGTAEAWNAFLTSYPSGFHADLARAYLKKLSAGTPAVAPSTAPTSGKAQELSCSERRTLRSQNSDVATKVTFINASGMSRAILWIDFEGNLKDYGGLEPGQRLTLDTFVTHPWMIATGPGDCLQIFMPDVREATVELVRVAADAPTPAAKAKEPPAKKPLKCGKNYELRHGECVLMQNCGSNAYRSAEGDCYCKKNYEMRNGRCAWKQDKKGFEVAPWKKTGCKTWQAQCNQGNNKACGQYEANCQVN